MGSLVADVRIRGNADGQDDILTPDALVFLEALHDRFDSRRRQLLAAREERQKRFDGGALPDFLPETAGVRTGDWRVAPIPEPLLDRRVEITGPVEAKMMINALNSGANVFMGDFEDSLSPTWANVIGGQVAVHAAVRRTLEYEHPSKGTYKLDEKTAVLVLRPRGWHLDEAHVTIAGAPLSASLFDFGLAFFHNAKEQLARGVGPYYYLPKIEHWEEAKLWDDVFRFAQESLGLPVGTIKATVLIETLPAAFQMDEILHALRDHVAGLNAGRWDYIFSFIKTLGSHADRVLPDRGAVTMTVPHMRAYTELLVSTCHKRGAFAMGGMSAFIPDRRDPERTEQALAQVRADKQREANDGCDGTWVAHPDLIPIAREVFDKVLGGAPNQRGRQRDVSVTTSDLLDVRIESDVTEAGVRQNVDVGLRYLIAWLSGNGAAAIHGLMEDAATAEISRSQIWQWVRHKVPVGGRPLTEKRVREALDEAADRLRPDVDGDLLDHAVRLFEDAALARDLPPFLTLLAYDLVTA